MILVIILYLICASMFTISKTALLYSEPIFFMSFRMLLSGILLGSYFILHAIFTRKSFTNLANIKADWSLFSLLTLFHIYFTYICDLCALKYLQSGQSAFLYNLSPFFTALFSYFYFNEKMNSKKWLGLSLGFISLFPTVFNGFWTQRSSLLPIVLTLIAVISSTYGWIIVRNLIKERGYSFVFINSFAMFFGGLLALFTSLLTENWSPSPVTNWVSFIQATALIIIVANILFYNLYGYLLNFYTATFLSFAGFMCPIYTGILGWLFLGESLSLSLIISFILVSLGLFIFYQEELSQGYINK